MTDTTTSLEQARRIAVELENENARLRAELGGAQEGMALWSDAAREDAWARVEHEATIARLRAELDSEKELRQETTVLAGKQAITIARVRAVLPQLSNEDYMVVVAALDGGQ